MPKKLKPDNNLKLESLFGNMQKDSKNKLNLNKKQETKNNMKIDGKNSKEKNNTKKENKNSKNPKTKIQLAKEEKEKESKEKLKPKKITNLKKEKEKIKEKVIEEEEEKPKEEKNTRTKSKKKLVKKKITSDSESYSISKDKEDDIDEINFSDYKMEIEEEEKEILGKTKNNKTDKNKKTNNKKEKIFDEDIDIDLEEIEKIIDKEEKEEKSNRGSTIKKSKVESTNKKSTRKKTKDVKTTTNKKKDRKDSASIDSNKIEGPLSDETIVITGEFSQKREELINILKNLGARVTGSVSSRTTILLHGELLEDGRPYTEGRKYQQAVEKNVQTLDFASFLQYVQKKTKNPNWTIDEGNKLDEKLNLELEEIPEEPIDKKNKKKNEKGKNSDLENKGELWTTKYQPKKLSDLIGNKTTINKLITWLDDWNSVVLEGNTKKVETKFHRGQRPTFENVNARACLISGDPGIGKTSAVRLVAKLKGYKVYESNASDLRNKSSIGKNVGFMFDNKTLFGGELQDKNLIIMDEIDGMSGNEDRGGISAIIEIIKKTKTPIICIANDRQSLKLKSLVNYCYDLKFVHPDKRTIALRLAEICNKENIQYETNALEYLCEICGNDIRQLINYIELWSRTHKSIKYKDLVGSGEKIEGKDEVVMLSNFDAAKELLNSKSRTTPYRKLLDLYFIDYDFIPLLIQENYLSTFPSQNYTSKKEELTSISEAADLISESDVIDTKIRTNMDWRLLADRGLIGCCNICKLNKGFVPFPKFPEIMGKMSSLNKIKRETIELKECFKSASGEEIRRQILPVIYKILIDYIVDGDIETVLEIMKKYHITIEKFKENMTDLVSEKLRLAFDKVGTSNKTNLTRAYNKNFKTSIVRNKTKKGKTQTSVSNTKLFDENGNPINEVEDEVEEENDESSEIIIDTKKGKSKTKGKTTKSKSKSKDKKNSKKGGKTKGKGKKNKKKKDEYEEDEDYDDEEE